MDGIATGIGLSHTLGVEFLPAILVVRVGGNGIRLSENRFTGLHIAVDADRRREKVTQHAHSGGCINHMNVDEGAIVHDLTFGGVDEARAADVCGQLMY
jgi:hypothetical protein